MSLPSDKSADRHDEKVDVVVDVSTADNSVENLYEDGVLDPVYHAKTLVLNRAVQELGMGKYQYMLFFIAGFGWFADSVWPLITGLVLAPIVAEFNFNPPFLSLAVNAGLLVGAIFWGLGCDIWGRKLCFNVTLFIAGVFGLASGGSPNFVTVASLLAVMGVGVGGNLPVDSAVFLDLAPASHQYLLTFMSVFWCLGQIFVNLIAWPLIANFSCGLTILLWSIRFFVFDLMESPRYLVGKGRDEDAVKIIHKIAEYNGTTSTLTVDQLTSIGELHGQRRMNGSPKGILSRTSVYTFEHIKSLFRTPKIAYSTSLLIAVWGLTGAFLLASTTARSSNALLGWNCGYALNSNIMYGVLYAISPEIFPAKDRGTGNGLVSTASRVFGLMAPIIALYADLTSEVPVYVAGALVIFAGSLALLLPYEPRGKASIHTASIRTQANDVWSSYSAKAFRPNLNVPLLAKIVSVASGEDLDAPVKAGKRKSRQSSPTTRATKRTRTSLGLQESDHTGDLSDESTSPAVAEKYPALYGSRNCTDSETELVPILHHTIQIQYLKRNLSGSATPDIKTRKKWDEEDGALQELLYSLSETLSSPKAIDLGEFRLAEHNGRIVGVSADPRFHIEENVWLFLLPALTIDGDSNDLSSSLDFLSACCTLQSVGKVHLDARLAVEIRPNASTDTERPDLPFLLYLEITVSLSLPATLDFELPKAVSKKAQRIALEDAQRRLLRAVYVDGGLTSTAVCDPVTVSTFYTIMGPAPELPSKLAMDAMQPDLLRPTLLPFQRRSVAWLLQKEGMTVSEDGSIVPDTSNHNFSFWREIQEGNHTWFLNPLCGELVDDQPAMPDIYGGMLAEEPGLGKTLETISLILLNPAPADWNPSLTRWDPIACLDVKAVKTTLIVTPPSLISQWRDELATHTPSLKVLIYDGWTKLKVPALKNEREFDRLAKLGLNDKPKKSRKAKGKGKTARDDDDMDVDEANIPSTRDDAGELLEWCDYVHQFDVVLTTYNVLRSEIYVARPAPDRPRREDAAYCPSGRARSPLVMVEWKRVVMDEVQMVGGGNAAEMVSLIPRLSSLAVSGTPAKAQMPDLIHVLKFLRIDQLVGGLKLWNRLLKPGFSMEFTAFLQHYGIRTAKANVTSELTIPPQTRYLVGIELGKVERHVYDKNLEAILLELGLDARGVAASNGWAVNSNLLRTSIRRLRGFCTHPQVGQLQRKGDGVFKPGALKTMDAVLQVESILRTARLLQKVDTDMKRYQHSLEALKDAEEDAQRHVNEIKDVLAQHDAKGKALIEEAALLRQQRQESDPIPKNKGKGKEREVESDDEDDGEDGDEPEDSEEKKLPKTPAGEEHRNKRRAIRQRLREGLLLLHQAKFFQGDMYHVLGNTAEEDAAYNAAEKLRRQILKATEDEANKAMAVFSGSKSKKIVLRDLVLGSSLLGQGGIRSSDLMIEINFLVINVLDKQAELMWHWRTKIVELVTRPLNPEDEVDGQEYQRTLDDQGEVETYIQAYAGLLADRRQALVNERSLLATLDDRENPVQPPGALDDQLDAEDLDTLAKNIELHQELVAERKKFLKKLRGRAIKSVLVDLTAVAAKILPDTHPERILVKDAIEKIRRYMSEQNALHAKLDADIALLRKAFNRRIIYFRQLQEISDSVGEIEWGDRTIPEALQAYEDEKTELGAKIKTSLARQRYLNNLSEKGVGAANEDENDQTCILCRCDFARGFITQCAHVFCEVCMKQWLNRRDGKTCPVCRVPVDPKTVQRFTINENEAPPQPVAGEPAPQSRRRIVYNTISTQTFDKIQNMETYGDFGSKIQTLVRHLLYLKQADPGAKSIVFSAWADSLHIVELALQDNGIKCLRIDQTSRGEHAVHKFRKDKDTLVLLLHGERENAGLNITCASRVFLLESVVHHSFEIQAIARIDRLGQTRPTEVYCYYAVDTIERNILDLATRKGLSLYTKDNSSGTVSVSPFLNSESEGQTVDGLDDHEFRQAKMNKRERALLQKGDFIHRLDDMLAILFPHMFEDIEFLLPGDEGNGEGDVEMRDEITDSLPVRWSNEVNAVAGPSRLR
ncbi:hypothetical protein NLJ89_g5529 [Agrocybe chaxingu]|uniref:Uncharacterized protein n=1 Tax=Agrocybe chaxingu TaxID=84603 RepID=A0A9W8K283_9AGAR|nr:hypothetical protein NLJ89_g5529 [Agrocybe chaxingu]